ncbi:MAG: hypothetical protein ABI830_04990 [Pseudolabrys sp.]
MRTGFALVGLVVALTAGVLTPAAAEFFGCNDKTSVRNLPNRAYASYTHEFAAQTARPRVTIHPRRSIRNATRHCRSWLAKEYRVSGTVIVPRQQCWWQ